MNLELSPRVLVLNVDPLVEAEGGRRLNALAGFNDPHELVAGYSAEIAAVSGGALRYRVVEWLDLDLHPVKRDGFRYTDASWLAMWRARGRPGGPPYHRPDATDYGALIRDFHLVRRVEAGEIDEVWIFAYPYAGLWESTMVGRGARWCNSEPVPGVRCDRPFVIMGFNPERGVGEMLENLGHRVESAMVHVYGSWDPARPRHAWDRFTRYDLVAPGQAACGNVHFAPNSVRDYDWGNPRPVWSTADDWLRYPHLTGERRLMTAADWGGGDIRLHHRWWLERLPKAPGHAADGRLNNWWPYVVHVGPEPADR